MDNLEIYNHCREVPKEAQKPINAGRLKGMTDINPMWRIKALTETFGPAGLGWWYTVERQWTETAPTGETCAFVNINLYYKYRGETSQAIPGTGGSMLTAQEKSGLHVSDECYKMALTDAISVAAKALGVGANIYWATDRDKYSNYTEARPEQKPKPAAPAQEPKPEPAKPAAPAPAPEPAAEVIYCAECGRQIKPYKGAKGGVVSVEKHCAASRKKFGQILCVDCIKVVCNG